MLAFQAGRPDEAERIAAQVLNSAKANVRAGQILGQALLMQGRAVEAVEPLARAAKRSGDPAVETLLARALSEAGRGDEALEALARATGRRPVYPLAFLELGEQLGKLGRTDEARAAFEAGLALAPEAAVLKMGLGYLLLGRNARIEARALFEAVQAAAPERRDARVALADVLALDGDYAAAVGLYQSALALRPDVQTQLSLGKCLLETGEREAGEAALRDAARSGMGSAIAALAATPRGRFFLRPSDAVRFLGA